MSPSPAPAALVLADPDLADQARRKLTGKTALDIPMVRGPLVSLTDAFATGEPVRDSLHGLVATGMGSGKTLSSTIFCAVSLAVIITRTFA
jgi:hypothetical protein